LRNQMPQNALRCRTSADIAETDEKHAAGRRFQTKKIVTMSPF
jgi:hypothetical protein